VVLELIRKNGSTSTVPGPHVVRPRPPMCFGCINEKTHGDEPVGFDVGLFMALLLATNRGWSRSEIRRVLDRGTAVTIDGLFIHDHAAASAGAAAGIAAKAACVTSRTGRTFINTTNRRASWRTLLRAARGGGRNLRGLSRTRIALDRRTNRSWLRTWSGCNGHRLRASLHRGVNDWRRSLAMTMEKTAALFRFPHFKTVEVVETGLAPSAQQQGRGSNQLKA
jgi:hypothetical protein